MSIRAVFFDIGGVLEITPKLGTVTRWEPVFHLQPGEMDARLWQIWQAGEVGTMNEAEVLRRMGEILGASETQVNAFMADIWKEYLGTLNIELADYFQGLRPRFQTAIISNSFVGAREREEALYHFEDMCDFIVYSHEVGIAKPDQRIFALACDRLGLQPGETILLDDAEPNIAAARAFGMHSVLFEQTQQAIQEIEALLGHS